MEFECRRACVSLLSVSLLLNFALLSEALIFLERGGSFSLILKPRLVLRHAAGDAGALLDFFNAETLGVQGELEDAINCSVSGGHLEEIDGHLQRITSVSIKRISVPEKWLIPKELSFEGSSTSLQTRTRFNVSYNVEGNLQCNYTLVAGLVSNTLLLRFRDRESFVIGLRGEPGVNASENYEKLRRVHEMYAKETDSKQEGRLVELKPLPEPEVVLRVSYFYQSGFFDQKKLLAAVTEATVRIAEENRLRVMYIKSTRYCLPNKDGNYTWPLTSAGSTAVPEIPYTECYGAPQPLRICLGNFFEGVHWEALSKSSHQCLHTTERNITNFLKLSKKLAKSDMLQSLYEEIADGRPLSVVEVYYAANILRKAAEKISRSTIDMPAPAISTIVNVISAILKCNKSIIRAADDSYGSSEVILESVLKLICQVEVPMPAPLSSQQFSVFTSQSGAGIQGFEYYTSKKPNKMTGRMMIFNRKHSFSGTLNQQVSTLIAYFQKQMEGYSMIFTVFEDESLFTAAEIPGMKLAGPILGVKLKLLQKGGEDVEEMRPITLLLKFVHSSDVEYGVHCVSWEPTGNDKWSKNACSLHFFSKNGNITICHCIILTSLDMFFTVVRDDLKVESNVQCLKLLPMKRNNCALLVIFRGELNGTSFMKDTDKTLSCSLADRSSNLTSVITMDKAPELKLIENVSYSGHQQIIFFNVTTSLGGYLQCKDNIGLDLISNRILLSKLNSASVIFSSKSGEEFERRMGCEMLKTNDMNFNFRTVCNHIDRSVTIHVTAISETNHSHFIHTLKNYFNDFSRTHELSMPDVRSDHYCLQHDEDGFTWPTTKLDHFAAPMNPCINNANHSAPSPVRKCIGGHDTGVYWDKSPQRPDPCDQPSERALRLQKFSSEVGEIDIMKELLESIKAEEKIIVTEANLYKAALKNLAQEVSSPDLEIFKLNITSVANFVNALIERESKINTKAEEIQTTVSSDISLDSIDKMLEKSSTSTPIPAITPHFSAVAVSSATGIKGFVTDEKYISTVAQNKTIVDAIALAQKAGAILVDAPEGISITFTIFKDSTLFRGTNGTEDDRIVSLIIGLNVFGLEEEASLQNTLVLIIFSHDSALGRRECHYWDMKRSEWSREGCARVPTCALPPGVPNNKDVCLCTHLTHFAMLIVETDFLSEDYILHLLTIIGCSVSLISLTGTLCIGITCSESHHGPSRKVQFNISASLTLIMVVYLAIAFQGECPHSRESCIALGALLHYSVLAAFSWMLVSAFFQLRRLSRSMVLAARAHAGTHLVLRASLFGWGVPALPVVVILIIGRDLYVHQPNSALCYPRGLAHKVGVLFPIALIVTINTFIFFSIMYSLFFSKVQGMRLNQVHQRQRSLHQFYATMFLFCLLGILWLPGLFINLSNKSEIAMRVLSYIFCITATLQGTSLFIFFVVCDRRFGERLSKAALSVSRKWSNNDIQIHYMGKSITSEKATDTMKYSLTEKSM